MMKKIKYEELNSKQQESYNFQKASAVLADYGYTTILLADDWQDADFIAMHVSGDFLKVQLKGRLTFDKKYLDKDLFICFPHEKNSHEKEWYLYPHDKMLNIVHNINKFCDSDTWKTGKKEYSWKVPPKATLEVLQPYKI